MTQLQRTAEAVGQATPVPAKAVRRRPHRPIAFVRVGDEVHLIAGRIFELDLVAGVAQAAEPSAHDAGDAGILRVKRRDIRGHDEVSAGGKVHAGENEIDRTIELPARQVHSTRAAIPQLDPFIRHQLRSRVEHDFADDNVAAPHRIRVQRVAP